MVECVHQIKVLPCPRVRLGLLGAVAFAELFDLVAALRGGFGGGGEAAAGGDLGGDFLPLGSFELATVEGVPFVLVGGDEVEGLLVGPGGGQGLGSGWGD